MESTDARKSMLETLADHAELVEVAALGAAAGAATGMVAGPPGIVAGGLVGAAMGAVAGAALEKASGSSAHRDRTLDQVIGVTGPNLGAREAAASALTASEQRSSAEGARHSRAELLAEHAELELLVEQLQEAVAAGDGKALVEPWRRFESGLATHLAVEERDLFPAYRDNAPSETHSFELAHAAIRKLADDIAVRIELHAVRADEIERLLTALRNHRRTEEAAFYRWAEQSEHSIDPIAPTQRTGQ